MLVPIIVGLTWLSICLALIMVTLFQLRGFERLPPDLSDAGGTRPSVTVIVPVRNEEANVERCLSGLLRQSYPHERLSVLVVDDGSTDETAAIVRRLAGAHPQLRLMQAGQLRDGWTGKANACWQGVRATASEWLCFVDADTASRPELLGAALGYAGAQGLDLLSLQPFQELETFWERLVMPVRLLMAGITLNVARVNQPVSNAAAANGQFILIRRETYLAVDGHAAVRGEILEDVALARVVKRAGYRLRFLGGGDLIHTRMYTGLRTLWAGQSKNAVGLYRGAAAIVAAAVMLLAAWLPIALPAWSSVRLLAAMGGAPSLAGCGLGLALAGTGLLLGAYALLVRLFFRLPFVYGLLLPLSFSMMALLLLDGARRVAQGGIGWKGRVVGRR